jgi:hypothetical protein
LQIKEEGASPEELKQFDLKIEAVRDEVASLKSQQKELSNTLATIRCTPTAAGLRAGIESQKSEIAEMESNLFLIHAGAGETISAEEMESLRLEHSRITKILSRREAIFKTFWGILCDNLPDGTKKEELWVSKSDSACDLQIGLRKCFAPRILFHVLLILGTYIRHGYGYVSQLVPSNLTAPGRYYKHHVTYKEWDNVISCFVACAIPCTHNIYDGQSSSHSFPITLHIYLIFSDSLPRTSRLKR